VTALAGPEKLPGFRVKSGDSRKAVDMIEGGKGPETVSIRLV